MRPDPTWHGNAAALGNGVKRIWGPTVKQERNNRRSGARNGLLAKQLIGVWNEHVWAVA